MVQHPCIHRCAATIMARSFDSGHRTVQPTGSAALARSASLAAPGHGILSMLRDVSARFATLVDSEFADSVPLLSARDESRDRKEESNYAI